MKQYLLCGLAFWIIGQTSAQTSEKLSRWSIGLTGGAAFPVGKFQRLHSAYGGSGVSTGSSAELFGEYRIWRSFSATLSINGQLNQGDGTPYDWRKYNWITNVPGKKSSAHQWQIARILAGGVYTIPLASRPGPALLVRALAGVQKTSSPTFSYIDPAIDYFLAPDDPYTHLPGLSLPWTFSYETDAGLKWAFPGRFTLISFIGYNGCKPTTTPSTIPTGTIHWHIGGEFRL